MSRLSVFCPSSVTLLRPTKTVDIFGNIFSLGIWAICVKSLGEIQGVLGDRES